MGQGGTLARASEGDGVQRRDSAPCQCRARMEPTHLSIKLPAGSTGSLPLASACSSAFPTAALSALMLWAEEAGAQAGHKNSGLRWQMRKNRADFPGHISFMLWKFHIGIPYQLFSFEFNKEYENDCKNSTCF